LRRLAAHGTTLPVTIGATGLDEAQAGSESFSEAWRAVHDTPDIQFAPVELKAQQTPGWLEIVFAWLRSALETVLGAGQALGITSQGLIAGLIGIAVISAAILAWRIYASRRRASPPPTDDAPDWAPSQRQARALLEEADRLAAAGQYDEATHLLLRRSIEQIAEAMPAALEPSSTAREIALLPALPTGARKAFSIIAGRVERSLFALHPLGAQDWNAARLAYADFALHSDMPRTGGTV